MAYSKRTMIGPYGTYHKVTQRTVSVRGHAAHAHTYQGGLSLQAKPLRSKTSLSAAGKQVSLSHRQAAGGAAVVGGVGAGLYVGHKWHQHNQRKSAEGGHHNTKVAR